MKEASVVAAVSQETLRPSSGQTTPVSIAALRKEPSVRGGAVRRRRVLAVRSW
jgi:hypothetical protein